jgi:hypothetical protein
MPLDDPRNVAALLDSLRRAWVVAGPSLKITDTTRDGGEPSSCKATEVSKDADCGKARAVPAAARKLNVGKPLRGITAE